MDFRVRRDGQLQNPPALWLLLPLLLVLPPVPIDETRHPGIAWKMPETSSWVTLHPDGWAGLMSSSTVLANPRLLDRSAPPTGD